MQSVHTEGDSTLATTLTVKQLQRVVGNISKARINSTPFGLTTEELILDVFKNYDFPILFNFPAGHNSLNMTLILGRMVTIKSSHKESKIRFKN